MLANARTGDVVTVLTDHDDAWVDQQEEIALDSRQPRISLAQRARRLAAHLPGFCERVESRHLVTSGEFDVMQILAVDREADWIYYSASPENPTQRYLYRVRSDGTGRQRVTPPGSGGHARLRDLSGRSLGDPSIFGVRHGSQRQSLISLPAHESIRTLADNQGAQEQDRLRSKADARSFSGSTSGAESPWTPGACSRPILIRMPRYPLLIHVYGEPAGQTVLDRWGGDNHLWHRMLAQNGYIVMSFDNRGTPAPRGRAWRKSVYHQIGVLAPKDQAAALREVLRKRPYHRPRSRRHLGLERRRLDELERHLQVSRPLQDGHRRRAGQQSALL